MTNVTEDIYFLNFMNTKKNIAPLSQRNYKLFLQKFTDAVNIPLSTIVTECQNQQDKVIEKIIKHGTDEEGNQIIEKRIIKFDPNSPESLIKQYLNRFIEYCKEQGNSNITINTQIAKIYTFLRFYNLTLPNVESLKDDSKKWYLLEKEDFKYILNDSSILHASLIKFLQSSGMRIRDALSLTIGDFMAATKDYHDFVDVNEFIDKAPADMIGTWYFHPHKTKKFKIPCLTFNDPETSNLILQNLRKIKNEYIPHAKKKYDFDKVMSKNDALFGSQKSKYIKALQPTPMGSQFWKKNQKLREWRIYKIKEAIKNGELSPEDYDKEVAKIPKFHAHGCRKYFETIIAKNCGNLRICTLMEGHVSPVSTDSSYIKQDIVDVKEHYMSAIDDFSLENTEVKVYTSEIRKEMEKKIAALENELSEKETKVSEIEEKLSRVDSIFKRLDELEKNRIV